MMFGLFSIARVKNLTIAEDGQVVGAAVPGQGVPVLDVVLLELLESQAGRAEAGGPRPGGAGKMSSFGGMAQPYTSTSLVSEETP